MPELADVWHSARPGPSTPVSGWVGAAIFVFVIMVGLVMFLIYKRKKRDNEL